MRARLLHSSRLVSLGLAGALTLAACGSGADTTSAPVDGSDQPTSISEDDRLADEPTSAPSTGDDGRVLIGDPPAAEPGLIRIDGAKSSLAGRANPAYVKQSDNRVTQVSTGESRAFQRLCVGEIDLVDSARPISPSEWADCRAQGFDIVQFQVAADAVVLAIKNESDVGGDCLDTAQISSIFGVGSTITNWSQVGSNFDDVPLRTGGPDIDTGELRFFGRALLNAPDPSLSVFAGSYQTFEDALDLRTYVAGSQRDRLSSQYLPSVQPRRERFRVELQQALRVLDDARSEVTKAVAEQEKGIRDQRTPEDRAADDERVRLAYEAEGRAITESNRLRAIYQPLDKRYQRLRRSDARMGETTGTLGLFPQSYYSVYENLLRPFEIQVADDDGQPNCIFPSAQTIVSGEYPLARQLLLTTTTKALERPEVADYLEYYLESSQAIADAAQAIALPATDVRTQLAWITEGAYPTFASVDGGPVEVQDTPVVGLNDPTAPPAENPAR